MRKPNLFLVGAPKAGSSLLWTMLKGHKDVFFTTNPEKEINYFSYKLINQFSLANNKNIPNKTIAISSKPILIQR